MRIVHLTPELPAAAGCTGGATRQFQLLQTPGRTRARHRRRRAGPGRAGALRRRAGSTPASASSRAHEGRATGDARRSAAIRPIRFLARRRGRDADPCWAWQASVFWERLRPLAVDCRSRARSGRRRHRARLRGTLDPATSLRRPVLLMLHNVGWHFYRRRADAAGGIGSTCVPCSRRGRTLVVRPARARLPTVSSSPVSHADADELARADAHGPAPAVVPNGVDTKSFVCDRGSRRRDDPLHRHALASAERARASRGSSSTSGARSFASAATHAC